MRTKFIKAAVVSGIDSLPSDPIVIVSPNKEGSRAFLTSDIAEYQEAVVVREAIGIKVTSHFISPITLAEAFTHVPEHRRSLARDVNVFLVVEIYAEREPDEVQEIDGTLLTYMGFNADSLRSTADSLQRAALSGISLAFPGSVSPSFRDLAEGICFAIDPASNRRIYHVHPRVSSSIQRLAAMTVSDAQEAHEFASALCNNPNLESIARLLHESSRQSGNGLLKFMAAWTALEVLVNKLAHTYEPSEEQPKTEPAMIYRFRNIANALSPLSASQDVESFMAVRTARNTFMHSMKTEISSLPSDRARDLVRRYLRLHIHRL
ncbi:MAG: hypothetical protein EOQ98_04725 [Mesorhizobium sp.]|uniref:hypothetical protein n=1 Tax=Mesorhizobium sp. TaxID=1871066 RepID=UPI000FE4B520|nr:hypothetical protein [Mesorhizobium sp.]RWP02516.1 MAG: hypothetical protein EOQ98_04725 [Mesorhizobium sp.]